MRNPYTVLGINSQAKPEEIKSAFRKLAKQYHPDHNRDDPKAQERFAEINQAYEILGDKDKRRQFDHGEINEEGKQNFERGRGQADHPFADFAAHFSQNAARGGGGQNFRGSHFDADDLFFRDLFGRDAAAKGGFGKKSGAGTMRRGADITTTLALTLEQVVGAENVEVIFANGKRLKIKLPDFVEEGQIIRLKGQGETVRGGEAGDALITIQFKPHARFRLEGRALHLDLPVSLKGAVLGTREEVDTLDGRVMIAIPPWSSSDKILRLRSKGLPEKTGGRADLYVHVRIMLPQERDNDLEHYLQIRY